jgi:hypothetical protein
MFELQINQLCGIKLPDECLNFGATSPVVGGPSFALNGFSSLSSAGGEGVSSGVMAARFWTRIVKGGHQQRH